MNEIFMYVLFFSSKTLQQLTQERDELEKVFRLAESLENQKRDEEKTKKLQELIQTKGIRIIN
jgi:TRAP-type C4-dicarboxylate transport system substrate-binding protein